MTQSVKRVFRASIHLFALEVAFTSHRTLLHLLVLLIKLSQNALRFLIKNASLLLYSLPKFIVFCPVLFGLVGSFAHFGESIDDILFHLLCRTQLIEKSGFNVS